MIQKFFIFFISFFILHSALITPLWAIGVKTLTGRIHVDNIPIGATIKLRDISGKVYRVINTSEEPMAYTISLEPPGHGDDIRDYEPLPNYEWVKLSQENFMLAPGQEALVDITFSFPDDIALLGKKFACFVVSGNVARSSARGVGISMKVKSKFTMVLSPDRLSEEQREKAENIRQRLEFQLTPSVLNVEDWPKGDDVNLKKFNKKTLKVVNPNDDPIVMTVIPITAAEVMMKPKEGYTEGALEWVTIEKKQVTIEPNTVYEIPININIPKSSKKQHFMFVVKVTLEGFDVPVNSYGRIYVITK